MHFLTSSESTSRYRVSTINFSFKCPVLLSIQGKRKNHVWQRTPSPRNDEKRLSIHSNGPCLLEGRTHRSTHISTHHRFHACLHPYLASSYMGVDTTAVFKERPTNVGSAAEERVEKERLQPSFTVEAPLDLFRNGEFLVTAEKD